MLIAGLLLGAMPHALKNAKRGAFLNSEFELGSASVYFYKHQKS